MGQSVRVQNPSSGKRMRVRALGSGPRRDVGEQAPEHPNDSTLVVVRAGGFWKDKGQSYRILVDGKRIGSVYEYDSLSVPVQPGRRSVQAKIDMFKSREVVMSVDSGETRHLVVAAGQVAELPQNRRIRQVVGGATDRGCSTCDWADVLTRQNISSPRDDQHGRRMTGGL